MTYMVIDIENNIKNTIGNHKGSAHCPENKIVYVGYTTSATSTVVKRYEVTESGIWDLLRESGPSTSFFNNTELLVGHNIKHDLLYLLRSGTFRSFVFPDILIWDTALAEYIITGQDSKFPSLDDCSVKYGGTLKDDRIKTLWDSGVDTDDIDPDLMKEYLKGDVENTEKVFLAQFEYCKNHGLLPLIWSQMLALKATTMCEHNGMYVDMGKLNEIQEERTYKKKVLHFNLFQELKLIQPATAVLPANVIEQIVNFDSPQFISKCIFGGECEWVDKELVGTFKTGKNAGQPKYKNVTKVVMLEARLGPAYVAALEKNKNGTYKVGEDELKVYKDTTYSSDLKNFIDTLLEYREISKEISTYIEGLREVIYPHDSCVHGNIHHTSTHTGRTSSSGPNLQNFTGGD